MSYAEKNLAPGESIVYRARYHWIYYRTALGLLLLAAVLGLIAAWMRNRPETSAGAGTLGIVATVLLVSAGALYLVRRVRASADEFVVTNRRVMRKVGIFAREAEHAPIEKIQDVTLDQGVAARLLRYGTVILETASERGRIVFPDIARPEAFRNAIWGQSTAAGTPAAAVLTATAASPAAHRLSELEDLRTRGLLSTEEYARKREEILKSL